MTEDGSITLNGAKRPETWIATAGVNFLVAERSEAYIESALMAEVRKC